MSDPVCALCDTRIVGERVYVGDLVVRGNWACERPCGDELAAEAHADVYDDEPDGDGPCRCSSCRRVRDACELVRLSVVHGAPQSWIFEDGEDGHG